MPIRKIPRNYRNVTGVAASGKAIGSAQFESTLERDFLSILEFSPDIARFEVQPIKIEWPDTQGRLRTYTPDVLVEFLPNLSRRPWLCEVKYRADIKKDWSALHPKFRQGIRYAKQLGWRFRLITEVEIRTSYLANIRFLKPFRFRNIPESAIPQLLTRIQAMGQTTPASLIAAISEDKWQQAEWLPVLWHLIATHRIGADLEQALDMDSTIWTT